LRKVRGYLDLVSFTDHSKTNSSSQFRNQPHSSWSSKEIKAEQQFESTLSQEQLQVLEQENHSMLEGFEKKLDQIKYHLSLDIFAHACRGAEKALLEISSLQSELITQLSLQASVTDRLYDDALVTTESVEKGNKQLVQAKKRQKSTIKFVFIFLMTMTLLLLFLDSWY
jgi:syntaxin 18